MLKEIIADVSNDQTRVALLEDRELVEIYIERQEHKRIVGNIYKGRVANVLQGMEAAFVDIGTEKNAFLHVGDIATDKSVFEFEGIELRAENFNNLSITDVLKGGQDIAVQVVKEAIGSKGARVTTNITLPGKYIVLMPCVDYVGVSKRIQDENERNRLKGIGEKLKPENMGLIIRTAAEGKSLKELKPEISFLVRLWNRVKKNYSRKTAPSLIYNDKNLIFRTVREMFTDDISRYIINNLSSYKRARELVKYTSSHLLNRIKYMEDEHIFETFDIESKILKAINRKVWLKCGGYLIIEQTEALTTIDVNTGKYVGSKDLRDTVFNTNTQAAQEITKQLRLRDIGGIIIIDFIDMESFEHKNQVLNILKEGFKRDRTKTNVLGITQLGLVEVTRKKIRERIKSVLQKPCPYCEGTGKVFSEETMAIKVKKKINRLFENADIEAILIEVHPSTAAVLIGQNGEGLKRLEKQYHRKIYIKGNDNLHIEQIEIKAMGSNKEVKSMAMPINEGDIVDLYIEERHTSNKYDGIAKINGYVIDIEEGGTFVGEQVKVEIVKTHRTYARARILG